MNDLSQNDSEEFERLIRIFLLLYFIQGLPYGLQTRFLPIYLRSSGMSLTNLGYFRMLLAPWVLKGLWAPIIDRSGDLRLCLDFSHILLIMLCVLASQFPPEYLLLLGIILFMLHLAVAVQDIALDGLLLELLTPAQLVTGNMIQIIGYKAGTLFSGGVFGFLSEILGWQLLFFMMAAMYGVGYFVGMCLPRHRHRPSISAHGNPSIHATMSTAGFDDTNSIPLELNANLERRPRALSLLRLFDVEGTAWVLFFVLVYKIGDQGITTLFPMFMIDVGLDVSVVTFWGGFMGQIFSIAGSLVGGFLRRSMVESLQVILTAQSLCLIVLFAAVVFWKDSETVIYAGSMVFLMAAFLTSGGVTTCTYTLIMQLSQTVPHRYRTSHYTLLATGEVAGRLMISAISGILVDNTSYAFTFGLFTVLSTMLIPFVLFPPRAVIIPT